MNRVNPVNQSNSKKSTYRPEIDGLRAIAVLSVIIFHFFPRLLANGYLGVDIFFVISGYLISTHFISVEGQSFTAILKSFYQGRIKRLFPALFLFLTLTYIFISNFFLTVDINNFKGSLLPSYTFWANFYFWRDGGYFGGNNQLKPLLHIWSLSVEEQFYLFFPVFFLISVKLKRYFKFSLELAVILVTTLSFLMWFFLHHVGGGNPAFFLLPTRVWQFGLGASLAIIMARDLLPIISTTINRFLIMGSVILVAIGFLVNFNTQVQTFLVTISAIGFIGFSKFQNNFLLSIFRSIPIVFFGKISYSLYLYHWPIAVALTYYFVDGVPVLFSVLGIFLSVVLGSLSFKFIEKVFRYQLKFNYTLYFLAFCSFLNACTYLAITTVETNNLANTIAKAKGTNFRCKMSSYRPYGSSRACAIKTTKSSNSIVALLGNSHAQMYVPLIAGVIPNSLDLLLVPLNECLPTTSINISQKCLKMAQKNLNTVLSDKDISTVIIATTWYGDGYIDANGNEVNKSTLKGAISKLVNEISSNGKSPVLLSPLATPNKNYADELGRKLQFNHLSEQAVLEAIKVPRSLYDEEFANINLYFEILMGDAFIKVYEDLCDQYNCFYGSKELFYFSDSNHLSQNAFSVFSKSKKQLHSVLTHTE